MSEVQGVNNAQSMSWLFAAMQSNATTSAAGPTQDASASNTKAFDPFGSLLAADAPQNSSSTTQPFSLDAMSALISAQEQSTGLSPDQQKVFSELDTTGDGKVTQSELEADFGTDNKDIADAVMKKLDTNGDGSIDEGEFQSGTRKTMRHQHAHHGGGSPQAGGLDALMQATQAASTQTTSNSDGSSTTTLTYADGSKVTLTTPAAATNSDNSTNSGSPQTNQSNLLEQLIKLQAQLTASMTSSVAATTA